MRKKVTNKTKKILGAFAVAGMLAMSVNSVQAAQEEYTAGSSMGKEYDELEQAYSDDEVLATASNQGHWEVNDAGWWYQYSDGTYPRSSWVNISNTSFVTRAYMRLSGGGYLKGFYSKTGITGGRDNLANIGQPTKEAYVLTDECRAYLKELLSYCNKLGIEHVLLLQPPHETQAADKSGLEQIESITREYGYDFLDLSTDYESIAGIDDSHDFADFEHLNAYGAKKLTAYIGDMAVNQYGIKSDTAKSELSRWKKSVKRTKKALKMAGEYTDRGEAQVVGEYEAAK